VLRKFIREIARETDLNSEEIQHLQRAVTDGFHDAVKHQVQPGEGRVVLKIDASRDEIEVEMSYREVDFPPAEQFSLS
jgi:anti-sigma regulatory factor (Ser/Thr protein kinase)